MNGHFGCPFFLALSHQPQWLPGNGLVVALEIDDFRAVVRVVVGGFLERQLDRIDIAHPDVTADVVGEYPRWGPKDTDRIPGFFLKFFAHSLFIVRSNNVGTVMVLYIRKRELRHETTPENSCNSMILCRLLATARLGEAIPGYRTPDEHDQRRSVPGIRCAPPRAASQHVKGLDER